MVPQDMNPQPYNLSSQNLNTPYGNTNQNQAFPQGQPNNPFISSFMQYYRPAEGIPLNNMTGGNPGFGVPNQFNMFNMNNINFENIKNISQLPHFQFTQPDDNTFVVGSKAIIVIPFVLVLMSLPMFLIPIISGEPIMFIMYFFALFPIGFSICFCIFISITTHFILGPDNITVKNNKIFRSQIRVFNSGELTRVEYKQNLYHTSKGYRFKYDIVFVPIKGEPEPVYHITGRFTFEEMGYFLHVINKHIQIKMCPK